jgi:transcriptional regulator with XRE-family HTH domain
VRTAFASNLRAEMARQRISQQALADGIGSTQAAVSYWTRGLREPSVSTLVRIVDVLGVSADCLLGTGRGRPDAS